MLKSFWLTEELFVRIGFIHQARKKKEIKDLSCENDDTKYVHQADQTMGSSTFIPTALDTKQASFSSRECFSFFCFRRLEPKCPPRILIPDIR